MRILYVLFAMTVIILGISGIIHGTEAMMLYTASGIALVHAWRGTCAFNGACALPKTQETENQQKTEIQ